MSLSNRSGYRLRWPSFDNADLKLVMGGAGLFAVIKVADAGLTYLSHVLFARWLGAFEFGIYSYCMGWATLLAVVAAFGMPTAGLRFVSTALADETWPKLAGFLRFAPSVVLAAGAGIGLAGVLLVLSADWVASHYRVPLAIALCSVFLIALINVNTGLARSFGRVAVAFIPLPAARNLPVLIVAVLLLVDYGTLTAASVVAITAACALASLLVQRWIFVAGLPQALRESECSYDAGLWLRVAAPLALISALHMTSSQIGLIVVGSMLGPSEAGIYSAALKTALLVSFVLVAVNALAAPRIAYLFAQGKSAQLQGLVSGVSLWIFWPSALAVLVLVLFGGGILKFFGTSFEAGHVALTVLALGQAVNAAAGPVGVLLNMTGHQIASAKIYICCTLGNVVMSVLLVPHFGIAGAATATALTIALQNLWLAVAAKHRLGINCFVFSHRIKRSGDPA